MIFWGWIPVAFLTGWTVAMLFHVWVNDHDDSTS